MKENCPTGCENAYYDIEAEKYYCPDHDGYLDENVNSFYADESSHCPKCNAKLDWEENNDSWYCDNCEKNFSDEEAEWM